MSREKRLAALIVAGVALPPVWYFAVIPLVAILITLSQGFALACGNNCDELGASIDRTIWEFVYVSIVAYVILMGCGIRWVMRGKPA